MHLLFRRGAGVSVSPAAHESGSLSAMGVLLFAPVVGALCSVTITSGAVPATRCNVLRICVATLILTRLSYFPSGVNPSAFVPLPDSVHWRLILSLTITVCCFAPFFFISFLSSFLLFLLLSSFSSFSFLLNTRETPTAP